MSSQLELWGFFAVEEEPLRWDDGRRRRLGLRPGRRTTGSGPALARRSGGGGDLGEAK